MPSRLAALEGFGLRAFSCSSAQRPCNACEAPSPPC